MHSHDACATMQKEFVYCHKVVRKELTLIMLLSLMLITTARVHCACRKRKFVEGCMQMICNPDH